MPLTPTYHEFAADLAKLASDDERAALAILRRGLGKSLGEATESYPILPRWLASGNPAREDACFLVATLFALHPQSWMSSSEDRHSTNLGASFRHLMLKTTRESVEARFVALLNCHGDDLGTHLRHAVSLLRSEEVPIDWAQLLYDVERWDRESRFVQRAWARAYWRAGSAQHEPGQTPVPGDQPERTSPADDESSA